jgi:hypothetical protein
MRQRSLERPMHDSIDQDLAETHLMGTPHGALLSESAILNSVSAVFEQSRLLIEGAGTLAEREAAAIPARALVLAAQMAQTERYESSGVKPKSETHWLPIPMKGGHDGEACWLLGPGIDIDGDTSRPSIAVGATGAVYDVAGTTLAHRLLRRAPALTPWSPETSPLPTHIVLNRIERALTAYQWWAREILAIQQDRTRSLDHNWARR